MATSVAQAIEAFMKEHERKPRATDHLEFPGSVFWDVKRYVAEKFPDMVGLSGWAGTEQPVALPNGKTVKRTRPTERWLKFEDAYFESEGYVKDDNGNRHWSREKSADFDDLVARAVRPA